MKIPYQPYDLEIIAGPCSITPQNTEQIINEIAPITTADGKPGIYGTRVVGLKSRTALSLDDKGMGIDWPVIKQTVNATEEEKNKLKLPSVELAEKIARETDLLISSEIMIPHLQLPFFENKPIFKNRIMIWNPAVEQLGWHLYQMNQFAKRNNWDIGIKHGKFLGKDPLEVANHPDYTDETTLEKVIIGLTTYVHDAPRDVIIIHRGLDVPGRGDYRNAIAHEIMKRVKTKLPQAKMFFDSTHSIGPKMRHRIVTETMEAMTLTVGDNYLYDGLLMEAGDSPTDTDEHVTIKELDQLVKDLSKFRNLRSPEKGEK